MRRDTNQFCRGCWSHGRDVIPDRVSGRCRGLGLDVREAGPAWTALTTRKSSVVEPCNVYFPYLHRMSTTTEPNILPMSRSRRERMMVLLWEFLHPLHDLRHLRIDHLLASRVYRAVLRYEIGSVEATWDYIDRYLPCAPQWSTRTQFR